MVCVHSNKGREIVLRQTKLFYSSLKSIWFSFVFVRINIKAEADASTIDVNKIYIFEWQFCWEWFVQIVLSCYYLSVNILILLLTVLLPCSFNQTVLYFNLFLHEPYLSKVTLQYRFRKMEKANILILIFIKIWSLPTNTIP